MTTSATSARRWLMWGIPAWLFLIAFLHRPASGVIAFTGWGLFVLTLGALPLSLVYLLLFAMGAVGGAFVLTWPIGREVNPSHLAGVAVAVVNLGGFLGAAVTQGILGGVLDARWTGAIAAGARVYPVDAYRAAFTVCAAFVLAAGVSALFVRETRCENVYGSRLKIARPAGAPPAR